MKRLLFYFGAGCLGALVSCVAAWLAGHFGITRSFGVSIPTAFYAGRLYPLIVWGGIWGWLFLFPVFNSRPFTKGTLLSLVPTAVQLFIIYPYHTHKGMAGIHLGALTPIFVFALNWVWGAAASLAIRYSR